MHKQMAPPKMFSPCVKMPSTAPGPGEALSNVSFSKHQVNVHSEAKMVEIDLAHSSALHPWERAGR